MLQSDAETGPRSDLCPRFDEEPVEIDRRCGTSALLLLNGRFQPSRHASPGSRDSSHEIAAELRAAATEPASQQAFRFLMLALHADETSAQQTVDHRYALAPWLEEAVEVWAAVLKPFRHLGECNYLDQAAPGPLFSSSDSSEPIVIVTTSGWTVCENLDMNRVCEFSNGVLAVRASMMKSFPESMTL